MDHLATHPTAKIRYYASGMQLYIESDAAYLVCLGAKSRVAGYFYMGCIAVPLIPPITPNAPVHIECKLLKHVVSSAAEAETTGIYANYCIALDLRNILEALGHKQRPIEVKTDNSTAVAFNNNELKARRSKSWGMR